jgi:L-ribulose-5-phosphate 4-epimerase
MKDEGVIKYHSSWIRGKPLPGRFLKELSLWRNKLYDCGLIGVTEDGIGFGNISIRLKRDQFIISGSGTGHFPTLAAEHYTLVTSCHFEQNTVHSVGPIQPSSESLTHSMIYRCADNAQAVIHVHHRQLWEKLLELYPGTNKDIAYGTVAMAREIARLFGETNVANTKLFAMGGHDTGIIAFGKNLEEAGNLLLEQLSS